jgi:pimeloyl-ACP methyl ester carboxylesterase
MTTLRGSIADMTYTLSTRMPDRPESGGPVRANVDDPGNRLRDSGCRHLLILVHGFNNSASDAKKSYLLLLDSLQALFERSRYAPDAIAFFNWPGDVGGWFSLAGYPYDIPRARQSAERLAQYLKNFPNASNPGALKISLIGHSLGCRLILEMLAEKLPTALALNIEVVNLMAPAVPIELVNTSGSLETTVKSPRQILKCHSRQDWVLWAAFPQGQEAAYALGEEEKFYGEAVGLYGHPTGVGISIETSNGHSDYWGDRNVANRFSAAIDPTFYTLPPSREPTERALPEASRLDSRSLPTRN